MTHTHPLFKTLTITTALLTLCGCPDDTTPDPDEDMMSADMGSSRMDQGTTPQDQGISPQPDMPADQGVVPDEDQGVPEDQGTPPEDMAPRLPTTLDDAQDQRRALLAELLCDIAFGCPSLDYDFLAARGRYIDRQTCQEGIVQDFGLNIDDAHEQIAVTSQRGTFDLDAAQRCVQMLRAEVLADDVCQDPEGFELALDEAGCDAIVKGVVPNGGDCLSSQDCADASAYCDDLDTAMNDACLGTCYAFMLPQTCDPECEDGQICDESTLTCVPRRGFMQACEFNLDCQADLFCGYDQVSDQGVCLRRALLDETCNFDVECVEDAFCDFDPDKPICTALKQEGEACTEYGQCAGEAYCDPPDAPGDPRVCVVEMAPPARVLNVVGMGQACGLGGNPLDLCEVGLACIGLMPNDEGLLRGTCGLALEAGGSCVQDSECVYPLACGQAGECAMEALIADAQSCEYSFECDSKFCDPVTSQCASSSMCVYMP